jgi:hypothetical protein
LESIAFGLTPKQTELQRVNDLKTYDIDFVNKKGKQIRIKSDVKWIVKVAKWWYGVE